MISEVFSSLNDLMVLASRYFTRSAQAEAVVGPRARQDLLTQEHQLDLSWYKNMWATVLQLQSPKKQKDKGTKPCRQPGILIMKLQTVYNTKTRLYNG